VANIRLIYHSKTESHVYISLATDVDSGNENEDNTGIVMMMMMMMMMMTIVAIIKQRSKLYCLLNQLGTKS
jgi:hypothetical protein